MRDRGETGRSCRNCEENASGDYSHDSSNLYGQCQNDAMN